MNARLPTPTPDQLIEQWAPLLRSLAYDTGIDYDDVRQEAWLQSAKMAKKGAVHVGKWIGAIKKQMIVQRDGVSRHPSARKKKGEVYIGSAWLHGGAWADDPARLIQAAQEVARAVGGEYGETEARWRRISQEIGLPRTAAEIAGATGCSARHGRRLAAQLRELGEMQADLFGCDKEGDE